MWTKATTAVLAGLFLIGIATAGVPGSTGSTTGWSDATLRERLEGLGFEPTAVKLSGGGELFKVRFTREGYNYSITFAMSPSRQVIWMTAMLRQLPEDRLQKDILMKVLRKNGEITPAGFALNATGWLYLQMPIPAATTTPVHLRRQIDFMAKQIRGTEELWNPAKWQPAPSPFTAAPSRVKPRVDPGQFGETEEGPDGK